MKTVFLFAVLVCFGVCVRAQIKLPALNVDIHQTTVSGLSAGGFMAVQMHVAFSDHIVGSAIFAGGPFHCAQGEQSIATSTCMQGLPRPDLNKFVTTTNDFATRGLIAPVAHMRGHKSFMFSGTQDFIVRPAVMDVLNAYYNTFGVQIEYNNKMNAAHTQPTDDATMKNPCTIAMPPYISNCNFDGAGAAFKRLFGELQPRNTSVGNAQKFDQSEFQPKGMDVAGFVYVPQSCARGTRCKLHISLHGCQQDLSTIGDVYANKAMMQRIGSGLKPETAQ